MKYEHFKRRVKTGLQRSGKIIVLLVLVFNSLSVNLIFFSKPVFALVTNTCTSGPTITAGTTLNVPLGDSVTLHGTLYCDTVVIDGTVTVTQYNDSDPDADTSTGRLILRSNSIAVGATGSVVATGKGYAGGAGATTVGVGGAKGIGGAGSTTSPQAGTAGTAGTAGGAGAAGSGNGGSGGAGAGVDSGKAGGLGGSGNLLGGNGGAGGTSGTQAGAGAGGRYISGTDPTTDETLRMGGGGGGGAAGAGAGGGGGGGGGGAITATGGDGGKGGDGGVGGNGGRGGGIIKLYATGSLSVAGALNATGVSGSAGAAGQNGDNGLAGAGLGGGSLGAGDTDTSGTGGNGGNATVSTGGGGGAGGGKGATGGGGGAGGGGGVLLRSEMSNGITMTGSIDTRSGSGSTTSGVAGTIKVFYACTQPSVGTNNGRVFAQTIDPTFGSILPTSGPTAGGQSVTITGARMCASPTVALGGALNPVSGPTLDTNKAGTVATSTQWAVGNSVKYGYTAKVGGNETAFSPVSTTTALPTVLDPTTEEILAHASEGVQRTGSAYTVNDRLRYVYAAQNHLGTTAANAITGSIVVTNAVSDVTGTNPALGITDATNGWAGGIEYRMWATLRVYPTQTDFENDTNGTETLAGTPVSVTTDAVSTRDIKMDIPLPNFTCGTPGANGCLWNQGRIRTWSNTVANNFSDAGTELTNAVALGAGTVLPHCTDDADTGATIGNGFKMGTACGDSGTWPSTFDGTSVSVHLRKNAMPLTPSPAKPGSNTTGVRRVDVTMPAPPAGLSSSPSTKNGLLYRSINSFVPTDFALIDTNTSYTASYVVNDQGNVGSGVAPTTNTTGLQHIGLTWSAVTNATGYSIYRCIGACSTVATDYDLVAGFDENTLSLTDAGIEENPAIGPPSGNQTVCQSPSVNGTGTSLTCTTVAHPAGLVDLTFVNNQPTAGANNFNQMGAYTYEAETVPPSKPGTPTSSSAITNVRPTWTWTESTDDSGINHYVFEWCTNSTFSGCGAGSGSATVTANIFTHTADLADGTWYARVQAFDTNNNASAMSETGAHVINTSSSDSTAPSVPGTPSTASPTADQTPTWTWTASTDNVAVSYYTLCWDTVSGGSANSAVVSHSTCGATCSFTHTTNLNFTTWYAKVKAVDTSENESAFSGIGTVVISNSESDPPTITNNCGALGSASPCQQTTYFNTNPTSIYDVDFSDSGSGLDKFQVRTCTAVSGGGTCGSYTDVVTGISATSYTNDWPLPVSVFSAMAQGTNYISVKAFDGAGNTAELADAFRVLKDTVSPTDPGSAAIASPTTDTTPTLSWTASTDATSGINNYTVQWSQDSDFANGVTTTTTAGTSCALSTTTCGGGTGLAEGRWHVRVRANDNATNTSLYSPGPSGAEVIIDLTSPNDPTGLASTSHTTSVWSNDTTVDLSWTAATDVLPGGVNANSGVDGYSYLWDTSAGTVPDTTKDIEETVTILTSPVLAQGNSHYFHIRTRDNAGNWTSTLHLGPFFIDTTAPSVPTSPAITSPTADTTPTFSWTASTDALSGMNNYTIQWSQDNTFVTGVTTATTAGTSCALSTTVCGGGTGLAEGQWYSRVVANDIAGNVSTFTSGIGVVIDTTAPNNPTALASTPHTTSTWSNDTTVDLTWTTAVDPVSSGVNSVVDGYSYEWSTAANTDPDTTKDIEESSTALTSPTLATSNSHYFHIRTVDNAGNWSSTLHFGPFYIDTQSPTEPGVPETSSAVTNDTTPTWIWSASIDLHSGVDHYEVCWDTVSGGCTFTGTASDRFFTHPTALADGIWYMKVKAVDALGNESVYTGVGSVTIDSSIVDNDPPGTPGTPTTPTPTSDNTPTWDWPGSVDTYGIDHYVVCWDTVSGGCSFTANASPNIYTHTTPLADGTWYVKVKAVDPSGNESGFSGVGSVLIDTSHPTIPGQPTTINPTNDTTPLWVWTASTDAAFGINRYELCWDTTSGGCTYSENTTTNAFTHTSALAEGNWYLKARAVANVGGNQSQFSAPGNVLIDVTDPNDPTFTASSHAGGTWSNDPTIDLEWTAATDPVSNGVASGVDGYSYVWSTSSSTTPDEVKDIEQTVTNITSPSLSSSDMHFFHIKTKDNAGNWTSKLSVGPFKIDITAPTVPADLATTTSSDDNTPTWNWEESTDAHSGFDHYEICWDTVSGGCTNSASVDTATFTHSVALDGGIWYAKVRAVDSAGNTSDYSSISQIAIGNAPDLASGESTDDGSITVVGETSDPSKDKDPDKPGDKTKPGEPSTQREQDGTMWPSWLQVPDVTLFLNSETMAAIGIIMLLGVAQFLRRPRIILVGGKSGLRIVLSHMGKEFANSIKFNIKPSGRFVAEWENILEKKRSKAKATLSTASALVSASEAQTQNFKPEIPAKHQRLSKIKGFKLKRKFFKYRSLPLLPISKSGSLEATDDGFDYILQSEKLKDPFTLMTLRVEEPTQTSDGSISFAVNVKVVRTQRAPAAEIHWSIQDKRPLIRKILMLRPKSGTGWQVFGRII